MRPLEMDLDNANALSMKWVKGELLTDLDAHGVDPTRQLDRDAQPSLFNRRSWFLRVWKHFPTPAIAPFIVRATTDGAIAWLFLVREPGGSARALANWYSFAFSVVFKGDPDEAGKRALVTAMAKRLGSANPPITRIALSPVARSDGSSALLVRAFSRAGWKSFLKQSSTSWTADTHGLTFAEFWAARPGQVRSTYSRKKGKAAFDVVIYDHFDADAWAEYEAVYANSWKPDEGAPDFIRETAEHESEAGCLRLGLCRIDGVAVAAQYWTVENGTAYIHKLAHRESAQAMSPGTILTHAMFKRVIDEDKVSTIDFGTGDDAYKADWMDRSEPLDEIILYNLRTMKGRIGAAKAGLKIWIRSFKKGTEA
jgi:Acetyltransferase (GNAT) domain